MGCYKLVHTHTHGHKLLHTYGYVRNVSLCTSTLRNMIGHVYFFFTRAYIKNLFMGVSITLSLILKNCETIEVEMNNDGYQYEVGKVEMVNHGRLKNNRCGYVQ